jgi:Holliday junction resolvase RusA-like endonuclease
MILAGEPEELAAIGIKPTPIELRLPFPPSVNGLYFNPENWRGRVKTPEYEDWRDQAGWELKSQHPRKMNVRCNVTIDLDDKRNGDADNRAKPVLDLLVKYEIIKNDSKKYVKRVSIGWEPIEGCRVRIEAV